MSDAGKLARGKSFYKYRDLDGNYPKSITNDEAKMIDLNFFLNSIKVMKPVVKEKK